MTTSRYRLSLHLSHPTMSANDIANAFLQKVRYASSVGAPRVTRRGGNLGGVYSQSDVSLEISDGVVSSEDMTVEDCIEQAMNAMPLARVDGVIATGGSCWFLAGVYAEDSVFCDFSPELLTRLAGHKMGLKIDFYGGPEEAADSP